MTLLTNYLLFMSDFSEIKLTLVNNISSAVLSFFKSHCAEIILLAIVLFVKDILPGMHWKR